jgi:mannose-6-phosphate isomerase-like protein (cupin superfamily)
MEIIHTDPQRSQTVRGADHGASVSLILDHSPPGQGPRLHHHPDEETWVVQAGTVRFTAGEDTLEAGPGDVVVVPPGLPHKFVNVGSEPCALVCIHASPTVIGEWLE